MLEKQNQDLLILLEHCDMDTLIITGWGWMDYACAAALALRHFGRAAVVGMSTRRLPEFLSDVNGFKNIVILGVGLIGNPEMLRSALNRLAKKHVQVTWISALEIPENVFPDGCPNLEVFVKDAYLTECVGEYYGLPCDDLLPILDEKTRNPDALRYHQLIDAAMFSYRNYQDEQSYGLAIRHLAQNDPESRWTESERRLVEHYKRYGGRELAGKSEANQALLAKINQVASHDDARVIIYGESGTGKETVAQLIHNKSPRKGEPFLAFNCASVTPNLLESRFFGHEKGSFTGANERKDGLFTLANGGTLFLDEIGELPLEAQGILLRVLEGGRFTRLGGTEELETNVRLITATNRDLASMVRGGKFREDLYFRLNVFPIRIPPLREHISDVEQIADGWWLRHRRCHLTRAQLKVLMSYDYPGNVRELINLLERATVFENPDFATIIEENRAMTANLRNTSASDNKPASNVPTATKPAASQSPILGETANSADIPDELDAAIRLHIRRVYEKYGRNLTKTKEALQIARNTLKKYLNTDKEN